MLRRLVASSSSKGVSVTASQQQNLLALSSSKASFFCTGTTPSPDLPLSSSSVAASSMHADHRSFSSRSALVDILAREEQEEKDTGNTDIPGNLADLKKSIEESWKIVEDGATTDLFKIDSPSGNKIQLSFHCQDTLEAEDEAGFDDEGEEVDEEEEASSPVRFTVTVTKAGKSLNFACFSEYGEVKIEGVSTTASSTAEYVHKNQGTLPKVEYQGPDFPELAEDLQEAIMVYLDEECGVNSDVAAFVAMNADYREEMQYVNFLEEAQSIVS